MDIDDKLSSIEELMEYASSELSEYVENISRLHSNSQCSKELKTVLNKEINRLYKFINDNYEVKEVTRTYKVTTKELIEKEK